jgi:hypothetical protein
MSEVNGVEVSLPPYLIARKDLIMQKHKPGKSNLEVSAIGLLCTVLKIQKLKHCLN